MVFRDNVLAGRFCWRKGLPYGPYAYTGLHCLPRAWSLRRSPRPHRPGRYFIPALKRAPAEISFRNSLRSHARCHGPVVSPWGISRGQKTFHRPAVLSCLLTRGLFAFLSLNSRVLLRQSRSARSFSRWTCTCVSLACSKIPQTLLGFCYILRMTSLEDNHRND